MHDKPVALVTGANKGIGLQIATDLHDHGFTVLFGSRDLEHGTAAAESIGPDAHAIQRATTLRLLSVATAERAARRENRR